MTFVPSRRWSTPTARGADPPFDHHDYVGTRLRAPKEPLVIIPSTLSEVTGPAYGDSAIGPLDHDLTRQHAGSPSASASSSAAACSGSDGKPLRGQLVEIWQANAAGRYRHEVDTHDAPLDPNFTAPGAASPTTTAGTGSSRSSRARTRGGTIRTRGAPITSISRSSGARSPTG